MIPSEEFLRHAAECRRMAKSIGDPRDTALWCEWQSDGIVARSWPVATIEHWNNAKRRYLESQLTSLALWPVDRAALADQFAFIISAAG